MPTWWVYIFWATIVFRRALLWLNVPGLGIGGARSAGLRSDMKAAAAARPSSRADDKSGRDGHRSDDEGRELASVRAEAFTQYCAACHRAGGGGQIGPNLTDDYWLHGAALEQIHKIVADTGCSREACRRGATARQGVKATCRTTCARYRA